MSVNGIGNAADISISGLIAQSARMKAISANIANSNTPGYRRRNVVLSAGADELSVQVQKIAQDLCKLLERCGIDFGILGGDEKCCGDPARVLGEERL